MSSSVNTASCDLLPSVRVDFLLVLLPITYQRLFRNKYHGNISRIENYCYLLLCQVNKQTNKDTELSVLALGERRSSTGVRTQYLVATGHVCYSLQPEKLSVTIKS